MKSRMSLEISTKRWSVFDVGFVGGLALSADEGLRFRVSLARKSRSLSLPPISLPRLTSSPSLKREEQAEERRMKRRSRSWMKGQRRKERTLQEKSGSEAAMQILPHRLGMSPWEGFQMAPRSQGRSTSLLLLRLHQASLSKLPNQGSLGSNVLYNC